MEKTALYLGSPVIDDCQNLMESYSEICVGCNKCGRYDKEKGEE